MINEKCGSDDCGRGICLLNFFSSLRVVGHGSSQVSPPPGICHPIEKNAHAMPGGSPGLWGGGGGCWEAWAHQRLTDALLICSSVTDTSACGRPGSSSK